MKDYKYNPDTDTFEWFSNSMVFLIGSTVLLGPIGAALSFGYMALATDPKFRMTRLKETMQMLANESGRPPVNMSIFDEVHLKQEAERLKSLMQGAKFGTPKHKQACMNALKAEGIEIKTDDSQ